MDCSIHKQAPATAIGNLFFPPIMGAPPPHTLDLSQAEENSSPAKRIAPVYD
jgi:hypothetical protein